MIYRLSVVFLFCSISLNVFSAQIFTYDQPLLIESGVKIKSAHTFVGAKDVDGKWKFRDSTVVNEGEYYGWSYVKI